MSDYSKRWDELQELVRSPEEHDLAAAGEDGAEQVRTRYAVALDGFKSYCDWRKQTLNQALWSMASSSGSADSRQSAWQSVFSSASAEAQSRVMDSLKNAGELAPALREFVATVAQEESQFFLQLGQIPVPTLQGRVIATTDEFQQAAAKLKEEWERLGDGVRSVGEKSASVCAQIRKIVYETVENLVKEDRGLTEKLNKVKVDPSKPPNSELAAAGQIIQATVQTAMSVLNQYTRPMSDYIGQLTEIASKEELFVVQFAEIRTAVAEFLQNTNLEHIATEYNEAKAKALELAVDCVASGARQDAIDFVQDAVALVDPLLKEFNRLYADFIDRNRGIFVGYVDLSRLDEMLKISAAESACEDLEKSNIEATLSVFLEHTLNWDVSIDGLFEDDVKALKDLIRTQLEPLSHGIVEANSDGYYSVAWRLMKDRLLPKRKQLEESKGASA